MPYDSFSWVSASGTAVSLDDPPNIGVLLGRTGLMLPPPEFVVDRIPLQSRQVVRSALYGPRDVDLPVFIQSTDPAGFRQQLRDLARALDPTAGDGRLRVVTVDGDTRELACRYAGGLEYAETADRSGPTWAELPLVFRSFDPYWYATAPLTATFANTGAPPPFFTILPLVLAPSAVLGVQPLTNPGDLEAWPVWSIVGPMTSATLTNTTTGLALTSTLALSAGETLTIDTRPGHKTITRGDGTNEYSTLTATSALWSLVAGTNDVTLSVPGATSATVVSLTYFPAWLSY